MVYDVEKYVLVTARESSLRHMLIQLINKCLINSRLDVKQIYEKGFLYRFEITKPNSKNPNVYWIISESKVTDYKKVKNELIHLLRYKRGIKYKTALTQCVEAIVKKESVFYISN